MKRLFVSLVLLACLAPCADAAFAYKRSITIDPAHTLVPSTQTNFPVLVQIDASNAGTTLKTVGNGGHINNTGTQTGGNPVTMPFDLIVTSDSAGTTKIAWEVESYDAVNGVLRIWVFIASLSNTTGATIYIQYGDAAVNTAQNTGSFSPSNVWDSNFGVVMHFPDGTTLSRSDSTSNAYASTQSGASAGTGQIDGAVSLSGASESNITVTNACNVFQGTDTWTLGMWVKGVSFSNSPVLLDCDLTDSTHGVFLETNSTGSQLLFGVRNNDTFFRTYNSSISDGAWHHLALVKTASGDNGKLYLDGALQTAASGILDTTPSSANKPIVLGKYPLTSGLAFNGLIDEFRASNSIRSADWIATEYNNQSAPLTFSTIGSEQSIGGTAIRHKVNTALLVVPRLVRRLGGVPSFVPAFPAALLKRYAHNPFSM